MGRHAKSSMGPCVVCGAPAPARRFGNGSYVLHICSWDCKRCPRCKGAGLVNCGVSIQTFTGPRCVSMPCPPCQGHTYSSRSPSGPLRSSSPTTTSNQQDQTPKRGRDEFSPDR